MSIAKKKYSLLPIVWLLIITSLFASVLATCGTDQIDREERAKVALEQKYSKDFVITHVYPQKLGTRYYEAQAYAVEEPEILFRVSVNTEDTNISDAYVERRICTAIEQQAEENLIGMPGNYFVFTHAIGPQPISDDPDISIQDYAALDSWNGFMLNVFLTPKDADAVTVYESLSRILSGMEYLTSSVRLCVVDEDQMASVQGYFSANDDIYTELTSLINDAFVLIIPCENGVLSITEEEFASIARDVF